MATEVFAPSFDSALVVGSGLIGSSIAGRLREVGVYVGLQDIDPSNVAIAAERGFGVPDEKGDTYDIAIIAVPPHVVAEQTARVLGAGKAPIATDVASSKVLIARDAARLGIDPGLFLPSHPMAGRAISGPGAAMTNLFEKRPWVITPLDIRSSQKTEETVRSLILSCGGVVIKRTPEEHDSSVALVSHLTQIVSSALAAQLVGEDESLELSGTALPDITRLGSSDPDLWASILVANAQPVHQRLRGYMRTINTYLDALVDAAEGNGDSLRDLLVAGAVGRQALNTSLDMRNS